MTSRISFIKFNFDPYSDAHLISGAATAQKSALGNLIRHGGIINMTDQAVEQITDSNFSTTAVKWGKYLFSPGANIGFGVFTDPRWCSVRRGFVGMVLRTNLGAGKKIAHCTNLEFSLETDGSALLKFSVTDRTAASATAKVVHSITGTTAFNSGAPSSRRVIIAWDNLQTGAADGALYLYVEDASGVMQLEASLTTTDIHPAGTFGFWVFGTGKNDPTWDRFYPANVIPGSNGWSKSGTFDVESVSDGILTITTSGTNGGLYEIAVGSLTKAAGWTVEIKMRERSAANLEEEGDGAILQIRDGTHVVALRFHQDRVAVYDAFSTTTKLRVSHNLQADLSTFRLTLAPGADVVKLYINGRHVGTSDTLNGGGDSNYVQWGDLTGTSGRKVDWDVAYVAYRYAEVVPQIGGMVGGIDDVVIGRFIPTATERAALATASVTDVFGNEGITPGSWIPPMPVPHTSNPTKNDISMVDMPQMRGHVAADGISDYIIGANAAFWTDTPGQIIDTLFFLKIPGGFPELSEWMQHRRTVLSSGASDNKNVIVTHGPRRIRPNVGLNELRFMWANGGGTTVITNQGSHRQINVQRA